ncbi:MAG: HlyC/CorC family transporter [Pseudomonadales bacterium]|jgi:magnesium and cobalt transporter
MSEQDAGEKGWLERLSLALTGEPSSRSELLEVLRSSEQRELLDAEALSIIEGALTVSDMQAREIMIPRSQMVVVRLDMSLEDILPVVIESGHSRFPVFSDNPDDVVGILLAKDLLPMALEDNRSRLKLKDLLRPCAAIPESKRLNVLLQEFRSTRNHLAVVFDEYGGVSGMVTIEDVLEQIVGDIEDEYDFEEDDFINQHKDGFFTIKARTPISDFNEKFQTNFPVDEFDTIGGVVTHHFGHLPEREETVEVQGFHFEVLNADNRRIKLLRMKPPRGKK